MPRFAVAQKSDYRVIDNGKSAAHNNVVETSERIHTSCIEQALAIAAFFHLQSRRPQFRGTKDMKRAYRQLSCWQGHSPFHIICVWSPIAHKWQFAYLHGLAFGLCVSVIHFNRIPSHLTAFCRRWLGLPLLHYFDDCRLHSIEPHQNISWKALHSAITCLGWLFDEQKDSAMASRGAFLGIMEDLSLVHISGQVALRPTDSFHESLRGSINTALTSKKLSATAARSIRGKLLHLSQCCSGKTARGQTFAFEPFCKSGSSVLPLALQRNLQFHLAIMDLELFRTVQLNMSCLRRVTIYSDASAVPMPNHLQEVNICYMIWNELDKIGGYCRVPDAFLHSMIVRRQFIAFGEAVVLLTAIHNHPEVFAHASIVWFIDNLSVLSALTNGASSVADFSCLIHAILLRLASLQCTVWWEYVNSRANAADGGTKNFTDVARTLGFQLSLCQFPPWPQSTLEAPPEEWLKLLLRA